MRLAENTRFALFSALLLLVMALMRQVQFSEPHPDQVEVPEPLRELTEMEDLASRDVRGTTCLELSAEVRRATGPVWNDSVQDLIALALSRGAEEAEHWANATSEGGQTDGLVDFIARTMLAQNYISLRRFGEARPILEDLLQRSEEVDPCFVADPAYLLGRLVENEGRLRDAVLLFERAIEGNPDHIPAHLQIVSVWMDSGGQAVDLVRTAEAINALRPMADARQYAADLFLRPSFQACSSGDCAVVRAVMGRWLNLPEATRSGLAQYEQLCEGPASCTPGTSQVIEELRQEMEREDARPAPAE